MSIPVLGEVYDEMRRLAIAGSAVAGGDFRLKKLIPPLEKMGEKSPVFGRVAKAAQAVVESNEKTGAAALLELTGLVNAILYTQGDTGIAGEMKPLETTDLGGHATQAGARTLKPLLEALTSTGSGRLEVVRDAHERGAFKDLRLIKPALAALDDPYPEVADFISVNVLPMYGKAIVPELRAKLDIKSKAGGHLQRLRLLHRLDPQGSRELVQSALNDGSKEMKVAAIECLDTSDADVVYLLEQSRAKAREVRGAALRALASAGMSSADAVAAVKKAIGGADLELIIDRVKESTVPEVRQFVLDQAEEAYSDLLKAKDKKLQGELVMRLERLIAAMDPRVDVKAEAFLLKCFENAKALAAVKSDPSGSDLNELVAHVMSRGTANMQKKLAAEHAKLSGQMLWSALFAARATMAPPQFYDEFNPLLAGLAKKKGADHERGTALLGMLTAGDEDDVTPWDLSGGMRGIYLSRAWLRARTDARAKGSPLTPLDPRWLDAAVGAGSVELVCRLARPGHVGAIKFLSEQLAAAKKPHEGHAVLQTMVKIGHPGAGDAIIEALKKLAKDTTHYYVGYWYGRMIPELPRSELPKFEELMPTLPDKMVDNLMDAVLALKNKSE